MSDPTITLGAATAAVVTAAAVARKAWPFVRRLVEFADDITGEEPRPGLPEGRPGLLKRMDALDEQLKQVRSEVTTTGGGSLKDAVNRIERTLDDLPSIIHNAALLGRSDPKGSPDIPQQRDPAEES